MAELTTDLIEHIENLEGKKLEAYYDVNGVLTIGYGHTNATGTFKFKEGDKITEEKALAVLLADLNEAEKYVGNYLKQNKLEVNDEIKEYMMLVYFNRPWALRKTIETIAEGNVDLIRQSQLDAYKEKRGVEAPQWFVDRIDKELTYVNEFDDPDESSGNATDEKEPVILYLNNEPTPVDANIADLIVKNTKYTYEPVEQTIQENTILKPETPVSVEEGEKEKEIKDVLTAHIYAFLQEQKKLFSTQVPKEAGSYEAAQIKTKIGRE